MPPVRSAPSVPTVRLTGRAARFLRLLQELGHLDDEQITEVILSLRVPQNARGQVWADVDVVRSAAALILFDRADGAPLPTVLMDDWPLLFS